MREILFRGKTREGKWNESSAVFISGELALMLTERPIKELVKDKNGELVDVIFNFCAVEKETVGQFTGLTDKNGKRIFEGDIISEKPPMNKYSFVGKVIWDEKRGAWRFYIFEHPDYVAFLATYGVEYTVIGNIHDNPELLEVE